MLILLGKSLIPQIYDILKKYPYRNQKNQGSQAVF